MLSVLRPSSLSVIGLVALVALSSGVGSGCAAGEVSFEDDGEATSSPSSSSATGGAGVGGAATTGGSGGAGADPGPCAVDCSTISTPDCSVAECNEGQHPGTVGECVVVPAIDGTTCDDGQFCTVNDSCVAGVCEGGPDNDCGLNPAPCSVVTCDEASDTCSQAPGQNGDPCQDPANLCMVNATCQNGLCQGGQLNDCFFAPVPDPAECHEAVCNPTNGMCEPQPANDGASCIDVNDLCTDNKTCSAGMCVGGNPKDCSNLTQGCNLGVCDTVSGQCTTMAVMNGDPCDDLDSCTTGETCNAGMCNGGVATTQCINADGCCPAGCTDATDDDCSCNVNLAASATPTTNGGGSGGFGPVSLNNGVDQAGCQMAGCSGCFTWISNGTSPGGDYIQYDWPSPVQIGSMFLDLNTCSVSGCSSMGRGMASGEVQYWNGASWVTAATVTNNTSDVALTFNPKLNTTALRVFNMTAVGANCGQASNTLIYEWYVWPGSGCVP